MLHMQQMHSFLQVMRTIFSSTKGFKEGGESQISFCSVIVPLARSRRFEVPNFCKAFLLVDWFLLNSN